MVAPNRRTATREAPIRTERLEGEYIEAFVSDGSVREISEAGARGVDATGGVTSVIGCS
jgi:hypothetical protein